MAFSELPGTLETAGIERSSSSQLLRSDSGQPRLCVFIPPSSGDPKALERAPAFDTFATASACSSSSSESDFSTPGEGVLWAGDSCPSRPAEWSNEEYAASLERLRHLLQLGCSAGSSSYSGEPDRSAYLVRYGRERRDDTPGYIGTPPSRNWKSRGDGRRQDSPGGRPGLDDSRRVLNILTQDGFRLLYGLTKCFAVPAESGENEASNEGFPADGDSAPLRRSPDLQAAFLQLVSQILVRIAALVESLPSPARPDGHGPTLRFLCMRSQGGLSARERRRRGLAQGEDGEEEFAGEGISFVDGGDKGERANIGQDGLEGGATNGQNELQVPGFSPLMGREFASVDTVLEAARVLRSLLLCGAFFVDWLVDETLRHVEEAKGGEERDIDLTSRGRGRRFAASGRSRQKGDGLSSVRSTRGGPAGRGGKRRKNEQMEVDLEDSSSPGVPAVFDDDEDVECRTEKRDKRQDSGKSAPSSPVSQLVGLLSALSEVALSSAAWLAFDSDFGGEKKDEERQRFYLLRALVRPLHVLYDEEKMKSQAHLQALFLSDDNLGERLKSVIRNALVALLDTIETRREIVLSARREMKRRQREEDERKRQTEKKREREDIMREVKHGVGGMDEEAEEEGEAPEANDDGDESKESEGQRKKETPEGVDKEDDRDDDEEEDDEGQLSWRTQLHSILLQPECKALVEVLTSPKLRRRRLPALVLRELTQQLKEQLLLCGGGVDKATAAQKKSFACAAMSLEYFATLLPRVWLSEKESLLQLFAADAYHIRKALLECLKALLLRAHRIVDLEEDEETEEGEDERTTTGDDTKSRSSRGESARQGCQTTGDDAQATFWGEDNPSPRSSSPSHRDALLASGARMQRTRAFWNKQRASLIHQLLLRLDDRTPLARTWALKVLTDLIGDQEALPTLCVVRSVQKSVDRLLDKSTLVRSAAVGVFSSLIHLAVKQQRAGGKEAAGQPFLWLLVHGEEEWSLAKQRVQQRQAERRRRQLEAKLEETKKQREGDTLDGEENKEAEGTQPLEDNAEETGSGTNVTEECQEKEETQEEEKTREEEPSPEGEIVDYEELAVQAEEALSKAIDICQDLLFSRSEGDQKAALRFLIDCCLLLQLRRRRLLPALQQALRLAFSRSAAVADLLLLEFYRLFLDAKELEEQQVTLRDHWIVRCELQRHEAAARCETACARLEPEGGADAKREWGQRTSRDAAAHAVAKRSGLVAGSAATLRPLERLLLHTDINRTVSGAFRFGAGRLLELVEEGDMASLACIEKLFVLALSKEGGNEHRMALKKAADALFALAMQPNFLLGRDATPRCALGLLRLLFQASQQTKHLPASSGELPSLTALPSEMPHSSLLRRKDERTSSAGADSVLHRLSNGQLLALQGAIVQQLKKKPENAARETRLRATGSSLENDDEGLRFLIVAELCRILAASLPDRRTTKAAGVALEAIMAHYGTTDPNWFSAAQAVIDVTFAHCGRPEHLWSQLLAHLLSHLLRQPSENSACAGAPASLRAVPASPSPFPSSQRSLAVPVSAPVSSPPPPCRLPPGLFMAPPSLYQLAHLVFLAGHVALRICILLEKQQSEVKHERSEMQRRAVNRRQGGGDEAEAEAEGRERRRKEGGLSEEESEKSREEKARWHSSGAGAAAAGDASEIQTVEGNMGMQTREEEEAELFTHIIENQIVGAGLLGRPLKRLILVAALEPQRLVRRQAPSQGPSPQDEKAPGRYPMGLDARGSAAEDGQENMHANAAWTPLKRDARLQASQPFPNTLSLLAGAGREDETHGSSQRDLDALSSISALLDTPGLATLHAAAVIALCKFATISRTFCESRICKTTSILHALISLLFSQPKNKDSASVSFSSLSGASAPAKASSTEKPQGGERREFFGDRPQTLSIRNGQECSCKEADSGGDRLRLEGSGRKRIEGRDRSKESGRLPSALRQTLLVCYGDLTCRHPNVLELYNDVVFNILQDEDVLVRHAGVQVFTHLVMNGMVKPKGRLLVLMLQLMRDRDARIRAAAEIFFCEVDRKGSHAIVNSLPELLGAIAEGDKRAYGTEDDAGEEPREETGAGENTGEENGDGETQGADGEDGEAREKKMREGRADEETEEDQFTDEGTDTQKGRAKTADARGAAEKRERKEQQRLVTFLLQFVKQHRHSEALIEKLCQRIAALPIPRHVIDSASPSARKRASASPPLSPSTVSSGEDNGPAAAARRVYFQAISAVCLSSPNLEKALRRLSSSFPLIRFAVATREEGGGDEILRDLLRRVSIKISGRWGATAGLGRSTLSRESKLKGEDGERGGADRAGNVGGAGGTQDVAVIREVVEELQKKLQAATEDTTEKEQDEGATLAEQLGEIGEGEEAEKEAADVEAGSAEGEASKGDMSEAGGGSSLFAETEKEEKEEKEEEGEGEMGAEEAPVRGKKRKGEDMQRECDMNRREKKRKERKVKAEEDSLQDSKRGGCRRKR
ncbi:condensin complex subunit 1 [Toxoplasma gondii MAS]|uniref:Condensin complex subunit 1 n=1 Tax=Toxoplasma gondii MAS TaxID=943118 RepID=A0A086PQW6_TOXGO|nr:condensin complex subunit 1 [Toxoplasma gondii MAS]